MCNIGPSGVRALPVAAGTNEGDHYFAYFSTSSRYPPTFYPRRDFLHGLHTHKNMNIPMEKKFRGPPYPPKKADFGRTKAERGRFSYTGLF